MIQIDVSKEIFERCKERAERVGVLKNSILEKGGNLTGFIGEEVVAQLFDAVIKDTYDYDLLTKAGTKIEVKTKKTSLPPKENYECTVPAYNTKQKCDYYAFVRVLDNYKKAWYLGCYPKKDFVKDARLLKKGTVQSSNRFVVRADCYNMLIKDLISYDSLSRL